MENLYASLGTGAGSSKVLKVEPGVSSSTPSYSTTGTTTGSSGGQCSSGSGSDASGGARTPTHHPTSDPDAGAPISSHEHQAHLPPLRTLSSPHHQTREGKCPAHPQPTRPLGPRPPFRPSFSSANRHAHHGNSKPRPLPATPPQVRSRPETA